MAQEEIIFKVGVDTGDSVQDVNKVGDAIENVGKDAKKVDGSFVNLRKELKQLTIQLQNLDPASKEFETVAKRAGQIKEQMRGVADAINDADPEKFGGKFQRTAEGIAGAFSAVTGAQALFGQQSEEIEKQMLKVQGAIALTQGISAMKELKNDATDFAMSIKNTLVGAFKSLSVAQIANATETSSLTALQKVYTLVVGTSTGALKAFKIALASTGIGLLIVGLGFLISKLMDTFKSTEEIIKINEKLLRSNERIINQIDRRREAIDRDLEKQLAYADAYGKSEEDKYNITKKFNGKTIEENNKEIQLRLDNVKKLKAIDLGAQASSKEQYLELVNQNKKRVVDEWSKINELKRANEDLNTNIATGQIKLNTQAKEERKKDNEDAVAKQKERKDRAKQLAEQEEQEKLALRRKISDLLIANIKDEDKRERAALAEKQKRELEDLTAQFGKKKEFAELEKQLKIQQGIEVAKLEEDQKKAKDEKAKAEIEKANNDAKALLEAEIIRAEEDFNLKQQKRIELENLDFAQQMQNTELTNAQKELLKAQHEANLLNIAKDSTERQKQLDEELANAKSFLVEQTSAMFGQLASSAQQGSAIQKAFAITQVTIDTAKSISSVIAGATAAAAAGGPAAPFLIGGYIASGIATVTKAFSSVGNILKQPLPSTQAPNMNRPTDNTQSTQQGTQQTVQAQSTYKVVVVDSDITKMQDKTKKVNAISTI